MRKLRLYLGTGRRFINDAYIINGHNKTVAEFKKKPKRFDIINFLLARKSQPIYLEIGVCNPDNNFNKIDAYEKYSVDPGIEFQSNPVDFKMTSDSFFEELKKGNILKDTIKFDVIFIDGLHLAEQVEKDIINSLNFIKDDGFIVLHDCNPPTEYHAREEYNFGLTPAQGYWNGTTWKAFYKFRHNSNTTSACIDTDFGVGIITKLNIFNRLECIENSFYEYKKLEDHRVNHLNLMNFESFKMKIQSEQLINND